MSIAHRAVECAGRFVHGQRWAWRSSVSVRSGPLDSDSRQRLFPIAAMAAAEPRLQEWAKDALLLGALRS